MAKCGSCGKEFEPDDDDDWNTLCEDCPVPHMILTRLVPGRDLFQCDYCSMKGELANLQQADCESDYPPCDHCGAHPYCERDCPGIAETLNHPDVYVAGFPPEKSS